MKMNVLTNLITSLCNSFLVSVSIRVLPYTSEKWFERIDRS